MTAPSVRLAALLSSLALSGLVSGCGGDDSTTAPTATPTATTSDSPSATPVSTPPVTEVSTPSLSPSPGGTPRLIVFGGNSLGTLVHTPADVSLLKGAPDSFKDFVSARVGKIVTGPDCFEGAGIAVEKLRTDGYAVGGVLECQGGGFEAVWARSADGWKQVAGSQELFGCDELEQADVPDVIGGATCAGADGSSALYHHA